MDGLSGNLVSVFIVLFATVLCLALYAVVDILLLKFILRLRPQAYASAQLVFSLILVLPMLVLVWKFSYTDTVFTALPPYLTGILVLISVLKSNLKQKLKIGISGIYLLMGIVFVGQAMS